MPNTCVTIDIINPSLSELFFRRYSGHILLLLTLLCTINTHAQKMIDDAYQSQPTDLARCYHVTKTGIFLIIVYAL